MTPGAPRDNDLLELLGADVRGALPLVRVQLQGGEVLEQPGISAHWVYFPVSAVISLLSTMKDGSSAEVALIGREGMIGLAGMLGGAGGPARAVVQIPGLAFKLATTELRAARARFGVLRDLLDRYTETHIIQTAQTAACNVLHSVDARLARWLLSIDDRTDGARFRLSQELIANALGIQRPTVSVAMGRLHDSRAIAYDGRTIVVRRSQLEPIACECYGMLRREFERLRQPIGPSPVPAPSIAAPPEPHGADAAVSLEALRQIAGRLLVTSIREQEAREDAEAANRAKDQFLAMASHELRTPLNAILGWCASLTQAGRDTGAHAVRVIQQNAAAELKLVEDLLDTVRLASSTVTMQPNAVHLGRIVQDAVDTAQPIATGKHVMLRLAILDELSPILADAGRLRQVFLNVVTNAVKFTDPGGSVDVSVAAAAGSAHVTVRDTGRGITPEMLPHVFERFRKGAPSAGGSQGLGLGLTIAQSLVELHGGRIQVASAGEGLGTTCTIELPIQSGTRDKR